ncbi:hypothetical protein CEXT_721451 [Caerostris extrusa]|uniref:Uncharacterized protein n=1 Tax=Caerostris extrusa TaxID=172846 RepID=A0AAV4RTZ0_CAEEX|nr:hypothetical protein CEXT_721451 [Caerostris extrusa]
MGKDHIRFRLAGYWLPTHTRECCASSRCHSAKSRTVGKQNLVRNLNCIGKKVLRKLFLRLLTDSLINRLIFYTSVFKLTPDLFNLFNHKGEKKLTEAKRRI